MGIVYFILLILILYLFTKKRGHPDAKKRFDYLLEAIRDLQQAVSENPDKKLADQLEDYKKELKNLEKSPDNARSLSQVSEYSSAKISRKGSDVLHEDFSTLWSNWYSNNSINLLLYVGAFLIVASASIFVGFQWESIGGIVKAILLSVLTLAFFGCGITFHKIPKIQNAGVTFTAIGALLIPFCGMAWYNFVFKDLGISLGEVWLVTSIISLLTNVVLSTYYKSPLYTYFASIGTLSLALSFVNISRLGNEFYILGSIISSFVLLLTELFIIPKNKDFDKLYRAPLEISANVVMPISIILGLIMATSENKLFSFEATFSAILASAYYFLCYASFRKPIYLLISEIIFPISVILLFNWQRLPGINLMYVISILGIIDLFLANSFKKRDRIEEWEISLTVGIVKTSLAFVFSVITGQETVNQIVLSVLVIASGGMMFWLSENIQYILFSTIFGSVTLYLIVIKLLNLTDAVYILGTFYLLFGAAYYFTAVNFKDRPKFLSTFLPSACLYFILSFIFSIGSTGYLLITNLVVTSILLLASYQFKRSDLSYLSVAFLYLSLFNFLRFIKLDSFNYPLAFSSLSFAVYFVGRVLNRDKEKAEFKNSALVAAISTPLVFGIFSFFGGGQMENNALMTSYAATVLCGIEALLNKKSSIAYLTSAVGMFTYLWQIHVLGQNETLVYTIPLGIYFLTLAYFRKMAEDTAKQQLFDLTGLFFLVVPTLSLSFNADGQKYWLILGMIGIILVGLGISLKNKIYSYGGIATIALAVLSQTYHYIFSLPKWLITGVAGMVFLISAIYLLLKRKEEK